MQTQIIATTPPPWWETHLQTDPRLNSRHTRHQYQHALTQFESWRADRVINVELIEKYYTHLQSYRELAPSSVYLAAAAIRWMVRRAITIALETRHPEADDIERRLNRVLNVRPQKRPEPLPAGRHIPDNELTELLTACQDGTLSGLRDAAMLAIAQGAALRNDELRSLKLTDIKFNRDSTVATLHVRHGKGDKARKLDLTGSKLATLRAWLAKRGTAPGYLFPRLTKSATFSTDHPLSYNGTRFILRQRFLRSGLAERLTWHDFRRTAIGKLFSANVDIATIAQIAGHEDPKTSKRYDRRPEETRQAALRILQD